MGNRTDAALSILVLGVVCLAFVLVGAPVSLLALVLGGIGTIGFELVTLQHRALVRHYWERPLVQGAAVLCALAGIAVGASVAPAASLSFALGALLAYLGYLGVAVVVRKASR